MAAVLPPSGESAGASNGLGSSQNGLAAKRKRSVSPDGENGERPPKIFDVDPERRRERERQLAIRQAEQELAAADGAVKEKPKEDPKTEIARMALTKAGGAYIPPHRLRAIMGETAALQGNASPEFQRLSWDALRKSINGLINKVNVANIKQIVPELFQENLIRARGLYCRSIMRAQAASLPFTPVFAALTAIINTKLPQVGELLLTRLVSQFRRSFKRNDKPSCVATSTFIAQLVNQQVAHELLVLQMLVLLLEHPTGDSVEIAVGLMREVGAFLAEAAPKANNGVFERFRAILHEGQVEKRVQYMIEVLFQVRREKFKDNPIIPEGLDLVEEDDIITHRISLDDELVTQDTLNIFKFDPNFLENEEKYKEMKREILGDSDDEDESGSEGSGSEEDDEDEEDEVETGIAADGTVQIHDQTETNMVNLRRTIYLTIMSALDFEEAVHKLLKINLPQGQESEMCNMVIECCSQERSYNKFYGLMAERLCKINRVWSIGFEGCFRTYYDTIHRYETNRLRNIAKLFGHLFASDGIPWSCLDVVKMTEEDTTSSSRIFTKIMFQEMLEEMGLPKLKKRLFDDIALQPFLEGIFPKDHPKNTRFSINFFTSIGLGALTEDMREHLKSAPALLLAQQQALADARAANGGGDSDSDSSSSSSLSSSSSDLTSSSSDSDSDSDSDDSRRRGSSSRRRTRRRSSTPPRRRRRKSYSSSSEKSVSRSPSPPPARRNVPMENPDRARMRDPAPPPRRASPSPPPASRRRRSPSDSRSPPRRRRRSPSEDSRSPPPARRSERDDRDAPRDRRGGGRDDRDYDRRDNDRSRR